MEEIPSKVTLAFEISNCPGNCPLCHSPFLKEDIGEELSAEVIDRAISDNFGINCVLLLGEGQDPGAVRNIARHIRTAHPGIFSALYSGRQEVEEDLYDLFDYVKVGSYIAALGPLNERTTNQRLYFHREDITSTFWRK